jgi:hypothetical protein
MIRLGLISFLFFCLASCSYFTPKAEPEAIARVGDEFLFKSEIVELVAPGTTKEDSIGFVHNFINRWATQKLLIKAAEVNISKEQQAIFNQLIQQYKIDLYTKAYLEEMVKREVDTIVSFETLKKYYAEHKDNFRTNGSLLKLRYIQLPKDHPKFDLIKSKFFDGRKTDRKFWETYQLQLKSSALNDSVWVEMNQVYQKLPFITPETRERFVAPGKTIQESDSLTVFFVKIGQVIEKNEICPFDYIRPTLKELIINQRKLELIKKIEKEIAEDAIKNKKYEMY